MREERTKFAAARVVIILGPRPLGRLAAGKTVLFFLLRGIIGFGAGTLDINNLNLIKS
jgi:ABC-type lipopolysaccharide export system ATPase subunit